MTRGGIGLSILRPLPSSIVVRCEPGIASRALSVAIEEKVVLLVVENDVDALRREELAPI